MFGLSKKERAEKELLSAFDVLLIGRKEDKTLVLQSIQSKQSALAEGVLNGLNPYEVAAKTIQEFILDKLNKCSKEERVDYLKRIADSDFKHQPHIIELVSHVNYCLMILEDESKPLVPIGSAEGFLTTISKWFAQNDRLLRRVIDYFSQSTQNHRYRLQQTRKRNERLYK
ncbi:MAG: hypothetical protein WD075_08400 [Rhodospirillales bacterium]